MPRRSNSLLRVKYFTGAIATIALFAAAVPAVAAGDGATELRHINGRFEPSILEVRANTPFKVTVTNHDKAAIEFESFELHRERVVRPGQTITVYMPPLAPGSYQFFDDFDHAAPEGAIISK
jgi:cupredoxin-like protein